MKNKLKLLLDMNPKRFEGILTGILIALILLETIFLLNSLIPTGLFLDRIFPLVTIKDYLYRIALLMFGLFALAKFSAE